SGSATSIVLSLSAAAAAVPAASSAAAPPRSMLRVKRIGSSVVERRAEIYAGKLNCRLLAHARAPKAHAKRAAPRGTALSVICEAERGLLDLDGAAGFLDLLLDLV